MTSRQELSWVPSSYKPTGQSLSPLSMPSIVKNMDRTERKPEPPSTPFFSESFGNGNERETSATVSGKLGLMEDQKLEAMFRHVGAQTAEE